MSIDSTIASLVDFSGLGPVGITVAAALLNAIISFAIERRLYNHPYFASGVALITASIATYFSFVALSHPQGFRPWTIVSLFLASVALWGVFCHVLAMNFGPLISVDPSSPGSSRLRKNWAKSIDYAYLTLSTLSILRIVVGVAESGSVVALFNAIAAVFLGVAVALRITKTSIEVLGWDKPLAQPA